MRRAAPPGDGGTSLRPSRGLPAGLPAALPAVLPAVLPALLAVVLLVWVTAATAACGVPVSHVLGYLLYFLASVTLPGAVVWRWARGEAATALEDLSLGSLVGVVVQLPAFVVGVFLGAAWLPGLVAVAVLAAAAATPRRAVLLSPGRGRSHPALLVGLTLVIGYFVTWMAVYIWRLHPAATASPANPYLDEPYLLSITNELRSHMPPHVSFVDGEALHYHWFVNAHVAAGSVLSGVPSVEILDILWMLPLLAAMIAAVAVTVRRMTGSSWAGLLAAVLLVVVGDFDPYPWSTWLSAYGDRFPTQFDWLSASQPFASAILVLVLRLALDLPRPTGAPRGRDDVRRWALLVLSVVVLAGAKATFLPMLLAGVLAVAAGPVLLRRTRPTRRALALVGIVLAVLLAAQVVLYGGSSQGTSVKPLNSIRYIATIFGVEPFTGLQPDTMNLGLELLLLVGFLLSFLVPTIGVLGWWRDRRWQEPGFLLLAGFAASGLGAALVFGHIYRAELYFFRATIVPGAMLSAVGVHLLAARTGVVRRAQAAIVAAGMLLGLGVVELTQLLAPARPDSPTGAGSWFYVPYLVVLVLLLVVAVATGVVARARSWRPGVAALVVVSVLLGLGLVKATYATGQFLRPWPHAPVADSATAAIGTGGIEAAYWLRDHSAGDDLVATNAHYYTPQTKDNNAFWMAAYSERHFLVEGWGYTDFVLAESAERGIGTGQVPFKDPALLRENDRAFVSPSKESVDVLRRHGVKWLLVDGRFPWSPRLKEYAELRHRDGRYRVYELR